MALTWPPNPLFVEGMYSLRFYATSTATAAYSGNQFVFSHPQDDDKQAFSKAIRIRTSAVCQISFDGVTDHGSTTAGGEVIFNDRYEAGICIKGSGTFVIEAW